MHTRQIAFPFRAKRPGVRNHPSADLIGRSYIDGPATIMVVSVCFNDDSRVMVERDLDGRAWSMPAWLMRLMFIEKNGKRAA